VVLDGTVSSIAGSVSAPAPVPLAEAYTLITPALPTVIAPVGFLLESSVGVGNIDNANVVLSAVMSCAPPGPAETNPLSDRTGPEKVVLAILDSSHAS